MAPKCTPVDVNQVPFSCCLILPWLPVDRSVSLIGCCVQMVDNTMELAQLLNQYQAHSVQLVSHVHDNVPTIVLIDTHVQRLLMNLLTNAIYHTARGTVQVELSIGDADDPSTH